MVLTLTKKGFCPLKLWFDDPTEMRVISNKRDALKQLFEHLDYKKIGRIDTLQFFVVVLFCIQGKEEALINNIMLLFAF